MHLLSWWHLVTLWWRRRFQRRLDLSGNPVCSPADPVQRPVGMFNDRSFFDNHTSFGFNICHLWDVEWSAVLQLKRKGWKKSFLLHRVVSNHWPFYTSFPCWLSWWATPFDFFNLLVLILNLLIEPNSTFRSSSSTTCGSVVVSGSCSERPFVKRADKSLLGINSPNLNVRPHTSSNIMPMVTKATWMRQFSSPILHRKLSIVITKSQHYNKNY